MKDCEWHGMAWHGILVEKYTGITGKLHSKNIAFHQVDISRKYRLHSSQNTGENSHFTGNTGITGGRAMPVQVITAWQNRSSVVSRTKFFQFWFSLPVSLKFIFMWWIWMEKLFGCENKWEITHRQQYYFSLILTTQGTSSCCRPLNENEETVKAPIYFF